MPTFMPSLQVPGLRQATTPPVTAMPVSTPASTGEALTLDALMARQKDIAERQQGVMGQQVTNIPQGMAQMAWTLVNALQQRKASRELAQGNADVANAFKQLNMDTGDLPPEAMSTLMARDPDLGIKMYAQAMEARRARSAAEAEIAAREDQQRFQTEERLAGEGFQERKWKADQQAEAAKEQREANRPQTDVAKIEADFAAGLYGDPNTDEAKRLRADALKKATTTSGAGTPADRKVLYDQQDQYINSSASIGQLNRAKQLLDQGINTGYTSGLQTMYGAAGGPGGDPEQAARTKEYNSIMNQEALTAMAQTLKGATTDTEMQRFIADMNDATLDPQTKARKLDAMLAKARSFNEVQRQRIGEMGGTVPDLPPTGLTPEAEAALLDKARKAIERGVDANLVKKRLAEQGGDPSKL